jgi:hypothetical protein
MGSNPLGSRLRLLALGSERLRPASQTPRPESAAKSARRSFIGLTLAREVGLVRVLSRRLKLGEATFGQPD